MNTDTEGLTVSGLKNITGVTVYISVATLTELMSR